MFRAVLFSVRALLAGVALICLTPHLGMAQAVYGTLSGRVMDTSGAAVPEAVITALDVGTNAPVVTVTGADGGFQFTRLTPGTYRLTIEKPGFRQQVRDDVALAVNEQMSLEAVLEVGAIEDTVVVKALAPLVQARSAEVSGLVDQKRVRELPLNGGNFQRLSLLAPGVRRR